MTTDNTPSVVCGPCNDMPVELVILHLKAIGGVLE